MKRIEHVGSTALAAGIGLFGLAGFLTGYLPVSHRRRIVLAAAVIVLAAAGWWFLSGTSPAQPTEKQVRQGRAPVLRMPSSGRPSIS